jgi:hypothetical protein
MFIVGLASKSFKSHELMRRHTLLLALCLFLTSCTQSDSIPMFGAFFPGWLFCITAGIFSALAAQKLLSRFESLWLPPLLTFLTLAILFSCVFWLLLFKP